ncbi:hypothetical protein U9M48_014779 [Paspalum notatum var. saurae]|uniref:Proton pump-interactor 1 n=1 Tax=Paspalum notatum var. saurae TaxID=547442 RepID=A0AAQ3T279_PASNO
MTAEGTACNGAAEAPRAEFALEEKAAAPEEKAAAGEREGDDLGGPFVIVNGGDSDGHSDRGSDLGGRAPGEDSPSEEDDAPASNAAPDEAAGGDHGAAGGEVGAVLGGASPADDGDRAADGSEGGADERKGEPWSDFGAEVAKQEALAEEDGGAATSASTERDHAANSEAPDVDSEVEGKEHAVDGLLVTDVAEAVVQEAASAQQEGEEADEVSCGRDDDALTPANSCSAATDINGADSNEAEGATDVVEHEPVEQEGTDGPSVLVENGHADEVADSSLAATEPETQEEAAAESCAHGDAQTCTDDSPASESEVSVEDSKEDKCAADFVEVVEQGTCGEDTLTPNLRADTQADSSEPDSHANESILEQSATEITDSVEGEGDATLSADSYIIASDSKVHGIEMEEQDTDPQAEEAPTTEPEISEGVLKATDRNCAGSVEELIGEVGEEVDACGHSSVEGSVDASREQEAVVSQAEVEATCGVLQLEGAGVVCSNVEIELPVEKEINEAVPNVDESVRIGSENKCNAEESASNEITAESDLKAENVVQVRTVACEVEETEVKELDDSNVDPLLSQQDSESALETVDRGKIEIDNDEVELKKEAVDAAPVEKKTNDLHLLDCDSMTSSSATVLESSDHVHAEDSRSLEISKTTVEQLICGASLDHGTVVTGEAEITSATENGYKEKPSDNAVDEGGPVDLNSNELVIDDAQPSSTTGYEFGGLDNDVGTSKDESSEIVEGTKSLDIESEVCNASTTSDECSSRIVNEGSYPAEEVVPLIEKPCLSDESCNSISSENLSVSTKLEALEPSSIGTVVPAEQKDVDERASGELHGDHAQIIGQQRMYIIRIPRFASEDTWAKMEAAQAHLDQLTQKRDAINHLRQKQKAVCDQYRERLEAARRVEREARTAHGDKKNDLNSVRSVLGKLHQANSIEEIDELIVKKERTMQHETITLREEKILIKEINDLKAQRKQLSSNIGSKAEINEAFDQRDHIHERHKELKKDSDVLFTNLKSLEENTRKIQKSFDEERIALRKLTEEHRAANEIRQKAYSEWSELKQEPFKKNKYFFMYRDDRKNAENFRNSGDIYGLKSFCNNQIEKVMEMWNKNEEFRKQYVESNKVSTLRRLGTLDGRKLGPDEEPPVIPSRRPSNTSYLTASNTEVPTLTSIPAPTLAAPASVPAKEDPFPVLPAPQIIKRAKAKASGNSAQIDSSAVAVSEAEDVKQTEKEKARLIEEQLELARKAEELARKEEELRKERAAAEKERLRLEQKAKAKEAEERKRRKAEKDKERAEFKARKEAEEKEKKKAKKDKKKGGTPAESSVAGDSNAAALATADTDSNASDNPREVDVPQPSAPKKLSRPAAAIKQLNRVQPMPAPLRNRGKRKMRQYLLIAAAVLSVLALFVAGNYIPRLKSVHF